MISGPSVQTLISQGYLSPYKLYAPSTVNMNGIHIRMGDYEKKELAKAVDRPSITGNAIEHYKRLCMGRRAIVFCASVEHSKHVVDQFRASGIRAEHVDGTTPDDDRSRAVAAFKAGDIQVLSNVELFGEGFDVPSMEAAILLRPTQSLGLYLQQVGRALRPFEQKAGAIILDHVGNYERHGLPDDERSWTLEGHAGRTKHASKQVSVKVCPKCFAAQIAGMPACRFCGYVYEVQPREVLEKEGTLEEVNIEAQRIKARMAQGQAQSLEELTAIGIQRGYKFPRRWAYFVFKSRQQKRLGRFA